MPHRSSHRNPIRILVAGLGLVLALVVTGAAAPAGAKTLGAMLRELAGNPGHEHLCLRPASAATDDGVPLSRPAEPCANQVVSGLYLGLLRDRERLVIVRGAMQRQRDLMDALQQRLKGDGASGELLLAELELNRWQVEEAKLVTGLLHAELFFSTVMETDPSEMVRPRFTPSAWPSGQDEALALLAQQESLPPELQPELLVLLQHAWIDYEGIKRELTLLESMGAFAADLARSARHHFDAGKATLPDVQARYRDDAALRAAGVDAEYRLAAVQLQILEILGRRSAIE